MESDHFAGARDHAVGVRTSIGFQSQFSRHRVGLRVRLNRSRISIGSRLKFDSDRMAQISLKVQRLTIILFTVDVEKINRQLLLKRSIMRMRAQIHRQKYQYEEALENKLGEYRIKILRAKSISAVGPLPKAAQLLMHVSRSADI